MQPRARSLLALTAALLVCSPVLAESSAVTIVVDGAAEGRAFQPIWSYFGYDEVNATTTPEGRELLRTLALANDAKVRVRTHFLFNSGDESTRPKWGATNLYSEDSSGAPVYDFSRIDAIMDAKVEAGVASLFELGFMPRALSTQPEPYETSSTYTLDSGSFYPPTDYEKWARLVTVWAEHARDRYAQGSAQADWLWELWNEPDIGYWRGTPAEYHRLYDYTEAALHAVLPDAALGGPAVARPWASFLAEFLEHCESGENAVTGARGTRLDFVSFHAKGGVGLVDEHVQLDLGQQLAFHRDGFDAVAASAFAQLPVIISEADPDGCAACPSTIVRHLDYRNSPAYGAYEVAMMKRSLDLAAEMQIDLRGVLTWAFTFPGSAYFAGQRALATNGVALPVLNAFKLLGRLRGRRLPVESSGALPLEDVVPGGFRSRPDIDALATSDGSQLQILTWHYHDDLVPAAPAPVTISVQVPEWLGDRVQLRHQRVDEAHGNAFVVWQQQGRPASPSPAQRGELLEASAKLELEPERTVRVERGVATLSFELPRFGVSLLTLTPSLSSEPSVVSAQGGCSLALGADARRGGATASVLVGLGLVAARRRAGERRRRVRPCVARRARPSREERDGPQRHDAEQAGFGQPVEEQVALGRLLRRGQTAHEPCDVEPHEATDGIGDGRHEAPVAAEANDLLAERDGRPGVPNRNRDDGCASTSSRTAYRSRQRVVTRWVAADAAPAHARQVPWGYRLDVLDVRRAVVVALRDRRVRQVIHAHDAAGEHDRDGEPVEAQPTEHVRFDDDRAADHETETHQELDNPYRSAAAEIAGADDENLLSAGADSHLILGDVRCHRIDRPSEKYHRLTSIIR